jgi:hypothetical protein
MPTTNAVKRAVKIAKEALEAKGYELVKFEISDEEVKEYGDTVSALFANSNFGAILDHADEMYEEMMPCYDTTSFIYKCNPIMRRLVTWYLYLTGNKRILEKIQFLRRLPQKKYYEFLLLRH